MAHNESWQNILGADETIIWQGRPDGTFAVVPGMILASMFGLAFMGGAAIWIMLTTQSGGMLWAVGLILFGAGLALLASTIFGPSFMRRRTWYTLTTRRAFIAKKPPFAGRSLKSYPITADTVIELNDSSPASVMFSAKREHHGHTTRMVPIGFERIDDARDVLQLLRHIQKDQA